MSKRRTPIELLRFGKRSSDGQEEVPYPQRQRSAPPRVALLHQSGGKLPIATAAKPTPARARPPWLVNNVVARTSFAGGNCHNCSKKMLSVSACGYLRGMGTFDAMGKK